MSSSNSFIMSGFTFRSLIHFDFIFVYGLRECSNFILLHVAVQFSQLHLLKRLSLLHCIFLSPLSKIRLPYVNRFISGLSILPLLGGMFYKYPLNLSDHLCHLKLVFSYLFSFWMICPLVKAGC